MTDPIDTTILDSFDFYLNKHDKSFTASIVGGGAIYLIARAKVTGDIDTITKIPEDIKRLSKAFALEQDIPQRWLNDNVSNLAQDFLRSGRNPFHSLVYEGSAVKLYVPYKPDLLLSKIFPMIDRPDGQDLDDISLLVKEGFISKQEFDEAITLFQRQISLMNPDEKDEAEIVVQIVENERDKLFPIPTKIPKLPITPSKEKSQTDKKICQVVGCNNPVHFRPRTDPKRRKKGYCTQCFNQRS
ncbi:DUF6036 family nucleotidyltransferase [Pseudobacteriovorax antillogorgiicola]|uniref:DUF6036 domain-containing protein n=1 Tax=Pseudobacteriovorax antillogorgiicola TaxID=1513793 RepID=A0A1Y6CX78_9BACT|nr:DUF6036 family nucleotidyltransferase [Pseudobacteriovorax antillogorgiicola]TCS41468.1 hypothetical protein EDD56_1484 [Pseudobacteriovorax antillogorgiicola]SMF83650.1 hypothetical protein SAMN06296036_14811 [Pseudobacteriovorax antillogorgiicola]